MIKIVERNLIYATEPIIGHQVNCQGNMNSGVAKWIRNRWPKVYSDYVEYLDTCRAEKLQPLGSCQFVIVNDKRIANLFGQEFYGYDGKSYTDIEALRTALQSLHDSAKVWGESVALPYKIGCGRGGASWREVKSMIADIFSDTEITLYRMEERSGESEFGQYK